MSNEVVQTENPFSASTRANSGALVEQETQRAVAEVQAAIMLAKRFPRDEMAAMDKILVACQRPTLAEQALYSYSRGGSAITGPSIRLAEAIAQAWGNLQFGIRELEQKSGESTIEAFAWDVENNTRQVKVFQVKHVRGTKQGNKTLTDPRDIYEMTANQGARRLRACILGVIPGDVVEAATKQAEETMTAKADTSPAALKKLVDAFAAFKVTKEQIEKKIQRRIEAIAPAQVVSLRKVYNSLRDGMSKPADWFEGAEEKSESATNLESRFKSPASPSNQTTKPEVSNSDVDHTTGEVPMGTDEAPLKGDTCPACGSEKQKGYCRNMHCMEAMPFG